MPNLSLRDYQKEALQKVVESFDQNINKQLIVMPTGAGKTILFLAVSQHFKEKTLILAHRGELLSQAYDKFKKFHPNASVSIYRGTNRDLNSQVIISSIQTCSQKKRLLDLKEAGFKILIIDEAHHATSTSYKTVIKELGFFDAPEKLLIGVTATPKRADKKSLKEVFQKITYNISIDKLINEKYLSPVVGRRILTNFSIKGVGTSMGDFAVGQLSEAVNTAQRNSFIVLKWQQHANSRKGIVFCANVQHCKDLAETFKKNNITAAAVWGNMKKTTRRGKLKEFSKGKITVLLSCSLLTEGYDEPTVTCIVMARPTKSKSLFQQMVGRGLRIDGNNSKKDCLVLDFNDKHHNLKTIVKLDDISPQIKSTIDNCRKLSISTPNEQKSSSEDNLDSLYNILGAVKFVWVKVKDEWSLTSDYGDEIIIQKYKQEFIASLLLKNGEIKSITKSPLSFRSCKKICENHAQASQNFRYADANSSWMLEGREADATKGQINCLRSYGLFKKNISKTDAAMNIRQAIAKSNYNRRHKKFLSL